MHHHVVFSLVAAATGLSVCLSPWIVATQDENLFIQDAPYYQTQAAKYRREAARLGSTIQRYEILERVYQNGSDPSSGTMNPQGRRLMVEQTKRVLHYFIHKKHETERQAANYEALAQALPTP